MTITTANTALAPDLVLLCHQFYAIGQRIVNIVVNENISNATVNAVCAEIKASRGNVNTFHTTILANLAAL